MSKSLGREWAAVLGQLLSATHPPTTNQDQDSHETQEMDLPKDARHAFLEDTGSRRQCRVQHLQMQPGISGGCQP